MAFVLSLFAGRLVQLQGVEGGRYRTEADTLRRATNTLSAPRGNLTDRDGVPLAQTVATRQVTADPSLITKPGEVARALAPVLGLDEDRLRITLSDRGSRFKLLADGLTPQEGDAVDRLELRGVFTPDSLGRTYPNHELAANVLGFVGSDGKGLGGLEYALDDVLSGRDGRRVYERGLGGAAIPTAADTEEAAVPGREVRLTLDRDIQWSAQRAIAAKVKEAKAESGTVVVMEPGTGKVLALATAPTFDPNEPGAAPDAHRGNRAVTEAYEPGSTGKLITAAAALEAGAVTPDTVFTIPPTLERGGKAFSDHSPHGTLRLTFTGVLAQSSNIGTILAAEKLGFEPMYEAMRDFGIGEPGGSGLPGASKGFLPPPGVWSATTPYTLSFGQGYSVNAVQMASVYATIANGGVRVQPTLIEGYVEPDGSFEAAAEPKRTRVVSTRTAHTASRMLEMVVGDGGTAPQAAIPGYRVAGKTGTAQKVDPSCGCYRGYTASFIGFAPADDPALVVAVTLQNPKNGRYGGMLGAPVFTEVMSFALKTEGVPPSGSKPPRMRLEEG